MAYNDITNRTDVDGLVPTEYASEIIKNLPQQSAALSLMRQVPMSAKQTKVPVMQVLPIAGFVNGDTGLKSTSKAQWEGLTLEAEPIAVICPIPEDVIADSSFDTWAEIAPFATEAIGRVLDEAVFFGNGSDRPSSWPTAIADAAIAMSGSANKFARGTTAASAGGLGEDLNQLFGKLEAEGYRATGAVADISLATHLRSARDTTGQKLADVSESDIMGRTVNYAMDGLWPTASTDPELIVGDFSKAIIGVRSDIQFKMITEGVITDSDGNIVYNLPQQDMVAMRLVARFAFQVANPVNRKQTTKASRYPFAVLTRP